MLSGLLGAVMGVPVLVAAVGRLCGTPGRVWGPGSALAGFAGAAVLTAAVLSGHTATWTVGSGAVEMGLRADGLSAVMLPLVLGVSAVVQVYARRYLYGDPRADYFFTCTALLTTASAALVTAGTLLTLAAAWSTAGIALCLLLRMYPQLSAARDGFARTARAFVLGDAALWAAVVTITVAWGSWDLRGPLPGRPDAGVAAVLAVLVTVAAASRSAQIPFHRWLPATLAAPTPVSALLHAGVVNAAAVLLIRTSGLYAAAPTAMYLVFAIGAVTTVYASVLMLTKPDIKGALAHSTMAQMGFMVMTCGLGLFGAAIFHLVAHGMYKATLFLGSGAAVDRHRRQRATSAPAALRRRTGAALAVFSATMPAAILLAVTIGFSALTGASESTPKAALLVFAWSTAGWACWAYLRRRPTPGRAAGATVVMAAVLPAYLAALTAFTVALQPPGAPAGVQAWWLAPVALSLLVLGAVRHRPDLPGLATIHERLYVWALTNAHPDTAPPPPPEPAPVRIPSAASTPVQVPA